MWKLNKLHKYVMADLIRHLNAFIAFAVVSVAIVACSDGDKTAGGTTEDAGIIADLNVAGVTQKGPFVKGSAVTVQGIDCKTLKFTDEKFEGKVKSDKGDFVIKDVNLSSTCAVFEVTGNYFNEVTGKKTKDKLTLHALTDLKDRKNVNINLLTELEYERVMNLAARKETSFADAKKQAEEEVLTAFGVNDNAADKVQEFENLNIFEKGNGNAALLAVSVMMQGDADVTALAKRLEKFTDDFAEDGEWNDNKTKKEIAEWAATATENGKLDTIRKNVESMNGGDKVATFEKLVENSGVTLNETSVTSNGSSSSKKVTSSSSTKNASSSSVTLSNVEGSSGSKSSSVIEDPRASYLNPNVNYGEFTDKRDGQTYKYVEINGTTWMAQGMNYATPKASSALCPSATEKSCVVHGLIYTWDEAVNVCPEGWRLPTYSEWNSLGGYMWTNHNGNVSGSLLSSKLGQKYTDEYGFSVTDANYYPLWSDSTKKYVDCYWDPYDNSFFWTDSLDNGEAWYFSVGMADTWGGPVSKTCMNQVRCVKGSVGSSSSVKSSSSVEPPKTALDFLNPSIEYGEFVDDRDNQKYKSVKIGNQVWMAQNLNYADSVKTPSLLGRNWCFKNDPEKCKAEGRLYTWAAAIDSVKLATDKNNPQTCGYGTDSIACQLPDKLQGVCPSGWHLPDTSDWTELFAAVSKPIGETLQSQVGWRDATNESGFSAIATGFRRGDGAFLADGDQAHFWSSTPVGYSELKTNEVVVYDEVEVGVVWNFNYRTSGFSVRCVKDDGSVAPVSSSSVPSSSSVATLPACKTESGDNCEYGTLTDDRDGQTYKTVKIGKQVWMAENLNYNPGQGGLGDSTYDWSWCFDDAPDNCTKYGRLYTWAAAMDSAATWSDNGKDCGYEVLCSQTFPVQGICPSGWHLPSEDEWRALLAVVGDLTTVGKVLKSQYGWYDDGNGLDAFGFTALPAGYRDDTGKFSQGERDARFWGASDDYDNFAFRYANSMDLVYYSNGWTLYHYNEKYSGLSVRCIKD